MTFNIMIKDELLSLINDRTYIDNLYVNTNEHINYLLETLTNLTYLQFGQYFNQTIDFANLTNLKYLKFGNFENQQINIVKSVFMICDKIDKIDEIFQNIEKS